MDGSVIGTTAIIASFLVPVVSYLKRKGWTDRQKYLLSLVAAFVAALAGALVDGHVNNWREAVPLVGTALATSQTVYALYFRNTEINQKLSDM
jgi:peptidoglycan/LPS O-acetylase OafA/YrhL